MLTAAVSFSCHGANFTLNTHSFVYCFSVIFCWMTLITYYLESLPPTFFLYLLFFCIRARYFLLIFFTSSVCPLFCFLQSDLFFGAIHGLILLLLFYRQKSRSQAKSLFGSTHNTLLPLQSVRTRYSQQGESEHIMSPVTYD